MSTQQAGFPALGYVANPFLVPTKAGIAPWETLIVGSSVNRLMRALHRAVGSEKPRPIWVAIKKDIPSFYVLRASNAFLAQSARPGSIDVLALGIPLETMRWGRTRGTLTELAETVAAVGFDRTLGAWALKALTEPDETLDEWAVLDSDEVTTIVAGLESDVEMTVTEYFGVVVYTRSDDKATDIALHKEHLRDRDQETDPDREDEDEAADEHVEALTVEDDGQVLIDDDDADQVEGSEADEEAPEGPRWHPVVDYVVAYTRAHLSPVVARAIKSYVTDGTGFVAQELKVTKAPRKTIRAITEFADARWERVVVLFNRFDPWPMMDDEGRSVAVAGLSELRWALAEHAIMALILEEGIAPELEEQFAAAERVDWDFPGIERISQGDMTLDRGVIQEWLDAAALEGTSPIDANGPELEPFYERANNDIEQFGVAGGAAFADAAGRGATTLDEAAIAAGLATLGEAADS